MLNQILIQSIYQCLFFLFLWALHSLVPYARLNLFTEKEKHEPRVAYFTELCQVINRTVQTNTSVMCIKRIENTRNSRKQKGKPFYKKTTILWSYKLEMSKFDNKMNTPNYFYFQFISFSDTNMVSPNSWSRDKQIKNEMFSTR